MKKRLCIRLSKTQTGFITTGQTNEYIILLLYSLRQNLIFPYFINGRITARKKRNGLFKTESSLIFLEEETEGTAVTVIKPRLNPANGGRKQSRKEDK